MLELIRHVQYPLWDFGWCSILEVSCESENLSAIEEFVRRSEFFKMTYIQPFENEQMEGDIHGPFVASKVDPSNYVRIDESRLLELIEDIYSDQEFSSRPTIDQIRKVSEFLASIDLSSAYFLSLTASDVDTVHEIGWILTIFKEFLIFDQNAKRFYVVVFGYD